MWISSFVVANVLYFQRKLILVRSGHHFDLFDLDLKDGHRLRIAAQNETRSNLKLLYKSVNWGFRLLLFMGIALLLMTRVPFRKFFNVLTGG
jgi:hypothetical protein